MEKAKERFFSVKRITTIAVVTAAFCVLAPLSIPIPISPVPLSLTNLVVFITVFIMDWASAAISYLLYLLLGLIGLPVFSGFAGGPAKLAGPTGGYLIGMIALILISAIVIEKAKGKYKFVFWVLGFIAGEAVLYVFGTAWLSYQLNLTFIQGLFTGVIPYLPFDGIKLVLALIAGPQIRKRLFHL